MPKNNPGPGTYASEIERSHKDDGYSFPLGPKDAMLAAVNKNKNPGPGTHSMKALDDRK